MLPLTRNGAEILAREPAIRNDFLRNDLAVDPNRFGLHPDPALIQKILEAFPPPQSSNQAAASAPSASNRTPPGGEETSLKEETGKGSNTISGLLEALEGSNAIGGLVEALSRTARDTDLPTIIAMLAKTLAGSKPIQDGGEPKTFSENYDEAIKLRTEKEQEAAKLAYDKLKDQEARLLKDRDYFAGREDAANLAAHRRNQTDAAAARDAATATWRLQQTNAAATRDAATAAHRRQQIEAQQEAARRTAEYRADMLEQRQAEFDQDRTEFNINRVNGLISDQIKIYKKDGKYAEFVAKLWNNKDFLAAKEDAEAGNKDALRALYQIVTTEAAQSNMETETEKADRYYPLQYSFPEDVTPPENLRQNGSVGAHELEKIQKIINMGGYVFASPAGATSASDAIPQMTPTHKSKQIANYNTLRNNAVSLIVNAEEIEKKLSGADGNQLISLSGAAIRGVQTLGAQARAIYDLVLSSLSEDKRSKFLDNTLTIDQARRKLDDKNWVTKKLKANAGASAEVRSYIVDLAYTIALVNNDRVTDKDFEKAMDTIGGGTVEQLMGALRGVKQRAYRKVALEYESVYGAQIDKGEKPKWNEGGREAEFYRFRRAASAVYDPDYSSGAAASQVNVAPPAAGATNNNPGLTQGLTEADIQVLEQLGGK